MKTINTQTLIIFMFIWGTICFARPVHISHSVHINRSIHVNRPSPSKMVKPYRMVRKPIINNPMYYNFRISQYKQFYNVVPIFLYHSAHSHILKTNIDNNITIGPTIENAKLIKKQNDNLPFLIFFICFVIGGIVAFFYCRKNM